MADNGIGAPSTGSIAAASTKQTECYREDTRDASGHYDVEAETEFDVKNGDIDGRVGLVEIH